MCVFTRAYLCRHKNRGVKVRRRADYSAICLVLFMSVFAVLFIFICLLDKCLMYQAEQKVKI